MRTPDSLLIEQVVRLLEERLGVRVGTRANGRLWLAVDGSEAEFDIQVKNRVNAVDVESLSRMGYTHHPLLLLAHELRPNVREKLRSAGVNHVDLAGNVFIRKPGLYVWLDPDRKPRTLERFHQERSLNPFAKKSSLVLRALLERPEKRWGVRELSASTGLSAGHASEIARALVGRGYAADDEAGFILDDPVSALGEWTREYDWTKNPRESFLLPFDHDELVPRLCALLEGEQVSYALTLLAGATRVDPHVVHDQTHVYVAEEDVSGVLALVAERLYGEPAPSGGNLHVLLPYYREAAFYGSRRVEGATVVSPVQLFLDLARYPLRGAEAARMLIRGSLGRQLRLDREQVIELSSVVE